LAWSRNTDGPSTHTTASTRYWEVPGARRGRADQGQTAEAKLRKTYKDWDSAEQRQRQRKWPSTDKSGAGVRPNASRWLNRGQDHQYCICYRCYEVMPYCEFVIVTDKQKRICVGLLQSLVLPTGFVSICEINASRPLASIKDVSAALTLNLAVRAREILANQRT